MTEVRVKRNTVQIRHIVVISVVCYPFGRCKYIRRYEGEDPDCCGSKITSRGTFSLPVFFVFLRLSAVIVPVCMCTGEGGGVPAAAPSAWQANSTRYHLGPELEGLRGETVANLDVAFVFFSLLSFSCRKGPRVSLLSSNMVIVGTTKTQGLFCVFLLCFCVNYQPLLPQAIFPFFPFFEPNFNTSLTCPLSFDASLPLDS